MAFNVPVASFKTTITSRIASGDTTITLDSVLSDEGTAIVGTFGMVIDEGTADEEFVIGTVSGSTLVSVLRGVSVVDGLTEVAALKKAHRKKATIKITAHPYLVRIVRALNGTDGFAAANILKYAAAPTITPGSNQIPDVSYVDNVAISGAANATTTTKGIVEIATQAENDAGTATGATGASLAATPAVGAKSVQDARWTYAEDAEASDTYVITLASVPAAYAAGQEFSFKANTSNTGAATLNVNSLGAKNIKKYCNGGIADLETNDINATQVVVVSYDGTQFLLQTPPATSLTSAAAYEAQQFFDSTNITGAQATTLSAGATSDAASIHTHSNLVLPFNLAVWGITNANATGASTSAPGFSDAGSTSKIAFSTNGTNTTFTTLAYMPVTLVPYFVENDNLTAAASGGALLIGTSRWRSEGTTIYKESSTVTISGTAPVGDAALGHDSVNSYLLVQDSATGVKRYSGIAGTTITFVSSITLDNAVDTGKGFVYDNTNSRFIFIDGAVIRRFSSSGATIDTVSVPSTFGSGDATGLCFINDRIYMMQGYQSQNGDATTTDTGWLINFIPTGMTR